MDYFILVQTLGGVLLLPMDIQWVCNTSLRVYKKKFGLNHIFILEGYCLNLQGKQYLVWGNLQTTWVQLFWFELLEGYCLNLQGKQYLIWSNLQTTWVQLFWFELLEGYCSCLEVFNSHALPLFGYPIKPFGSITNLLEFGKVLHSPSKT